ncbi:hypothetical protein [Ruegeria intermedia]|uniref:hypothetical protein n=1 Tax=Ruegeria intermedia TaxID=996115 RepID=UPI001CB73498|nr:hypothetical protein [Ruegeria intermedia]
MWCQQAEHDAGKRAGLTSAEKNRIKELGREVRELRQANEILKKPSAYFAAAELDRPFRKRSRSSMIIVASLVSGRSAGFRESHHRPSMRMKLSSVTQSWRLREPSATRLMNPLSSVFMVPLVGVTALARSGTPCAGKGATSSAALGNG